MDPTKTEITKLNTINSKISSLNPYLKNSIDKLKTSSANLATGVIINHKSYDDGLLNDYALQLEKVLENLQTIGVYCSNQVELKEKLAPYQAAGAAMNKVPIVPDYKSPAAIISTNSQSKTTSSSTKRGNDFRLNRTK